MSRRKLTSNEIHSFLSDLEKISSKHGICVGGCGCCGSPFLYACKIGAKLNYQVDFDDSMPSNLTETKGSEE